MSSNIEQLSAWPWEKSVDVFPALMPDGSSWPRLTIITPSFNQGEFLEQAILSVVRQGYPNLEYIIIDGGSSDQTQDVIRKYESLISWWVSEPDKGIYDAMNKGIARATGDLIGIIACDDWYSPDTFRRVAETTNRYAADVICGSMQRCYRNGKSERILSLPEVVTPDNIQLNHPTWFVKRDTYQRYGCYSLEYRYASDLEMLHRLYFKQARFKVLSDVLANHRVGGVSTNEANRLSIYEEILKMQKTYRRVTNRLYYFNRLKIFYERQIFRFRKILSALKQSLLRILR